MPATIPKPPALNTSPVWPPAAPSVPPERAGEIAIWFDGLEDQLVNPAEVEERLRRTGWSPAQAVGVAAQYRRRFNEHSLGYSALLVATGLAALAAGTAGHLLTAGLDGPVDRNALGGWLTLLVCALPFAVWGHWWAAQVDRDDPVAAWSRPRRALGKALLWSAGVVGVGRLLIYAGQLMSSLVGASWVHGPSVLAGAVNVMITLCIAGTLFTWAFRFLHRFDSEDPTVPVAMRHRARPAREAS